MRCLVVKLERKRLKAYQSKSRGPDRSPKITFIFVPSFKRPMPIPLAVSKFPRKLSLSVPFLPSEHLKSGYANDQLSSSRMNGTFSDNPEHVNSPSETFNAKLETPCRSQSPIKVVLRRLLSSSCIPTIAPPHPERIDKQQTIINFFNIIFDKISLISSSFSGQMSCLFRQTD